MSPAFFTSYDGALCRDIPAATIVRPNFARHYREITTGAELRACLRAGAYAWPGGYALYFVTSDGAALSFAAVRSELHQVTYAIRHKLNDGWRVVALASTECDEELAYCDHTGERIE
jgi:hypothetical protein